MTIVPVDDVGGDIIEVVVVNAVMSGLFVEHQLLGLTGFFIEFYRLFFRGNGIVLDGYEKGAARRNFVHDVLGAVFEDRFGARQRHRIGDFTLNVLLDGRGLTLGSLDHNSLARADDGARAGEHALLPVFIDGLHVSNGVADVFRLPLWYHPGTVVAFAVAPGAVIKAKASVVGRTELLEHHNVMLGIFKTEKAGP